MLPKRELSVGFDTDTNTFPFQICLLYFISLFFSSYYVPIVSMILSKNNLNHPFQASYLGLFTNDYLSSEDNSTRVLEDINLYYQPLQVPEVAIVFFFIKSILIFLGEYLHYKVLVLMKEENGIVKNVARMFVLTQMVFYPFLLIMMTLTDFIHPVSEVFGQWICIFFQFSFHFLTNIIGSYSFVAALMRYFFILHQPKVGKIGKEKVKKFFLFFMIFIATLMTVWIGIERPQNSNMSFINKCYGKHHNAFLLETASLNYFSDDLESSYGHVSKIIKRVSRIIRLTVTFVIGLNISEGLLYFRILYYMNK